MKKLLLIILLLFFCVSMTVDAKLKFGNWDKWDEEFPPPETYLNSMDPSRSFLRQIIFPDAKELICVAMNRYMCKDKKCTERVSIILFSPKGENPDDTFGGAGDYQFALVAFPPDKNEKMIIRAYKKEKEKLEFLEEWAIPYENHYTVLPVLKENKFMLAFKEWVVKEGIEERLSEYVLNIKLVVFDSKESKKFALLLWNETEMEWLLELLEY